MLSERMQIRACDLPLPCHLCRFGNPERSLPDERIDLPASCPVDATTFVLASAMCVWLSAVLVGTRRS